MVAAAVKDGSPGLGISDHGNLYGLVEFYKACKTASINPVLGMEAYFTDDRLLKESVKQHDAHGEISGSDKRYYHLTIFAENNDGYQNLIKLSSDAFINGFHYKPRADWSSISAYSKGLIATSGCLGGPVLQKLLYNDYDGALATAARLQEIFGRDNFFIELMNHGIPEQAKTNPLLLDIAKKIDAPIVATQDVHYVNAGDAHHHDILLCCQTGAHKSDEKRFKFASDQHYMKTAEEMYGLFNEVPIACDNTLWITERASVQIDFDQIHLPDFPIPEGFIDSTDFLAELVISNVDKFYPDANQVVWDRISYELGVFQSMGVSSYMLILWDLMEFARSEGIFTPPGRGSAAGSIVSYILGITKVDPIQYDLIFERFLNPSRIALPDVDLDIEQRYREKLINYTIEKYGSDHVAQIITFGKIKARTSVRDAARVLGYPPSMGDKISKLMPKLVSGVDTPLYACFEHDPKYETGFRDAQPLRALYNSDDDVREIIDAAVGLEGLVRSVGVHAAGIVIGDRPLQEIIPLTVSKDGSITTQWGKKTVEALGLVKMDYLGLKNLDVLSDTEKLIGGGFKIDNIPMDDFETFSMLKTGNSIGCFQIESSGMRDLLKRLKPDNIKDISAVLALFRPGPMAQNWHNDYADRKNGLQRVTPFHEDAAEILKDTYGLMIYQEQIMKIASQFAGYSLTEADNLRKIIGKKEVEEMKKESVKFIAGCISEGYNKEFSEHLFETIDGFSLYGFNLSHSISYSFITYWTAYLKTHYPREYMACLCTYVMDDLDKTAVYLNEVRRLGLKVYPPDLNLSNTGYTVEEDGIRIGLNTLKNMGEAPTLKIMEERDSAVFTSLYDFAYRINPNVQAFRALAWSGALDSFGTRQGIASIAPDILAIVRKDLKKDKDTLFDNSELVEFTVPETEFQWHDLLNKEKETLGLYVSGHPLSDYTEYKTKYTIDDLKNTNSESFVKVLGIVNHIEIKVTKKQEVMAIVNIEDETGSIEVVVFPKTYADLSSQILSGAVMIFSVRPGIDYRDERNYILGGGEPVESKMAKASEDIFGIFVPKGFHSSSEYMSKLKGVMLQNHGRVTAKIYISRSTVINLDNQYLVEVDEKLKEEIKSLFQEYRKEKQNGR